MNRALSPRRALRIVPGMLVLLLLAAWLSGCMEERVIDHRSPVDGGWQPSLATDSPGRVPRNLRADLPKSEPWWKFQWIKGRASPPPPPPLPTPVGSPQEIIMPTQGQNIPPLR